MLGKNLTALRNMNGLTQEELAEKVGVSRQAYAKWEKGTSVPDVERCMALAEFFGTTVENLMREHTTDAGTALLPPPKGKYIWGSVTISERGQIVIPKVARETFSLKCGDRLVVLGSEGEGIALKKAEDFEAQLRQLMEQAGKENG
ncbi:MAG: helix-turn-helix domain-containing protein [Clostridia bacterium]|nr:helix-turn-helix domain-containing protein [Clostridia bacterium]